MAGDLHGFVDSAIKALEHLARGQFMNSGTIVLFELGQRGCERRTVLEPSYRAGELFDQSLLQKFRIVGLMGFPGHI
jgi:hypothetical protein